MRLSEISGTAIPVEGNDIDTDRIIPARYLKEITFTNMGEYAFYDERFEESGAPKTHSFNDPRYAGASILIVNKNFGCGSSREHAPQAILRSGIRAIVGESFAEIFAGNCTVLGIPTVVLSAEEIGTLMSAVKQNPKLRIRVSLAEKTLTCDGRTLALQVPDTVWKALTEGTWDSTRLMLANLDKVRKTAAKLPYLSGFAGAA
ncbi:3-isopropylmalate dehydratase small subunit [bacterium]|nr:3-isopropylmalate dehydratase small subunit [bacterium]